VALFWLVIFITVFLTIGWLCVFRTNVFVCWARKNYQRSSRLIQIYPFHSMVLKPWFPTYIRCTGILIWAWALIIFILEMMSHFR
jgi:hypothetical protein